jgi:DNA-binding winged helix-turn-helix (wHTH) protein
MNLSTLRSYVRYLRKKIEDDPVQAEYIVTEPWVGYRFCDPNNPNTWPQLPDENETELAYASRSGNTQNVILGIVTD